MSEFLLVCFYYCFCSKSSSFSTISNHPVHFVFTSLWYHTIRVRTAKLYESEFAEVERDGLSRAPARYHDHYGYRSTALIQFWGDGDIWSLVFCDGDDTLNTR
jgi:hypothetical protein